MSAKSSLPKPVFASPSKFDLNPSLKGVITICFT